VADASPKRSVIYNKPPKQAQSPTVSSFEPSVKEKLSGTLGKKLGMTPKGSPRKKKEDPIEEE